MTKETKTLTKQMKNRVYGLIGIGAKMSNWNASFEGLPKMTLDGDIFGSDKAIKYSIRNFWKNNGEKVLYAKRLAEKKAEKTDKNKKAGKETIIAPKTLEQTFLEVTNLDSVPKKEVEILEELFDILDVVNFGSAFLIKDYNISVTGAVQFSQGFNIYEDANIEIQDIISQFSSGEDKEQTTIGKMTLVDETHYVYPFSINPINYKVYEDLIGEKAKYTTEVYEKFKKASLQGATALSSVSKTGSYNEFGLFIELKEESKKYVAPLHDFVTFDKKTNTLDFQKVSDLVKALSTDIEKAELYVNNFKVNVKNTDGLELKDIFDI